MRNFQKLKEISDYKILDIPENIPVNIGAPNFDSDNQMILRMLVRPKYGDFTIPNELDPLWPQISKLARYDWERTGIKDSWCYVTVRHGEVKSITDDDWHFDGSSFRTDIIPERNYIWTNHTPTEYKYGSLDITNDFDPIKHNLFKFAEHQLKDYPLLQCESNKWYLLSPFCLHRRPKIREGVSRTFVRICFTDIEGRDINNTENPLLPTPFFGRDPVKTFRDKLIDYYHN